MDGNLTSDGRFTYTWDAENRLIAMETHATVPLPARRKLAFFYDAMNRRISKTVWHGTSSGGWQLHHKFDFIHQLGGWNILAERSGGSKDRFLRTYTWGTDLSGTLSGAGGVGGLLFTTLHTSGKTFANAMDLNGNVTLLVDTATGQSTATYDYGPFGEPLRQSGEYASLNPFRFSTKYTDDETGMMDYGLRPYNPSTGTWSSRDPIGEKGGMNLYGFAGNDGINRLDVLGMADQETYATVRGAISAGGEYALDGAMRNLRERQARFDTLTKVQQVMQVRPSKPYEYGSRVCCNSKTPGFYYHSVYTNKREDYILLGGSPPCKDGDRQAGFYHSHSDASGLSPEDIQASKNFPVGETHFLKGLDGEKTTFISPASTQ